MRTEDEQLDDTIALIGAFTRVLERIGEKHKRETQALRDESDAYMLQLRAAQERAYAAALNTRPKMTQRQAAELYAKHGARAGFQLVGDPPHHIVDAIIEAANGGES